MKKRILSILLCICMVIPMMTLPAFAAANNIDITDIGFYKNGDVKEMTIEFGWDTASASSRLTVMTERLRSAGESGTDESYGDFTDYGYYGGEFKNWSAVMEENDEFGIIFYSDEQKISMGGKHEFEIYFDEGDMSMDDDGTYYLYLWTYYGGYYYPDNLFAVLRVEDGEFQYAPAVSTNRYGKFITVAEAEKSDSSARELEREGEEEFDTVNKPINFIDVKPSDYFAEPVAWAVDCGVTNGTGSIPGRETFSPDMTCTRAHNLTFLWRAAGCPFTDGYNPYYDVKSSDWFYDAAIWAYEQGIYESSNGAFAPNTPCTRGSTVEYLWKSAWCQNVETVPFSDVAAGTTLSKAVSWAVENGVTNGTGGTTFSPNQICTRGQIVTLLFRYFVAPVDNTDLINTLKKGTAPAASSTATSSASSSGAYTGPLDPLPPMDYMLQPDWYGTLTPAHTMSNARLVAEYENIEKVIADRQAKDIYMSDGPYSRELDLWSQLSQRCDIVERYDRAMENGSASDHVVDAYNELVAKYGSADPLRASSEYD